MPATRLDGSDIPAISIRIALEKKTPTVRRLYSTDGDAARLEDWLNQQQELLALVARAIELEEAA
jgi:hypothetical protein